MSELVKPHEDIEPWKDINFNARLEQYAGCALTGFLANPIVDCSGDDIVSYAFDIAAKMAIEFEKRKRIVDYDKLRTGP